MPAQDPYKLLGVPRDASPKWIRDAYEREIARALRAGATRHAVDISAAYDTLSSPASRALYDRHGVPAVRERSPGAAPPPTPWRIAKHEPPPAPRRRGGSWRAPLLAVFSLGIVVGLLTNFGLWLWTSKVLPNTKLPWRAMIPGAILGAIGLEALKAIGGIYVPRAVASSSQLYGSIGVVFATLAWLYFFGRLIVYTAVLNVVLHEGKAGTVVATIEVPRQPGASPGEEVSRMGRLEEAG